MKVSKTEENTHVFEGVHRKIDVLNHGFVRLVDSMGSDLSIVRNARVSYDAEWRTGEDAGKDEKLIGYLMRNGHNTPFEAGTLTFDIKAPIFVFRQWHRHRTQSYNELSARYRPLPEEWYVPDPWVIGTQSSDNKQMRHVLTQDEWMKTYSDDERNDHADTALAIDEMNKAAFNLYDTLLECGTPRELARSVLPVGMYSHMFATANLHNWFRFLRERLHPHAQYEIRVYAKVILEMIEEKFPIATKYFKETLT